VDDEGAGLYDRLEAGRDTGPYSDPARLLDRLVSRQLVRDALDALPEWARQVLLLAVVQEMRYREIAEVLGVPEGTVMSRLSRARRALEREVAARAELPDEPAPRVRVPEESESAELTRLRARWGPLPESMRALAARPPLLRAAELAMQGVVEDGALPAALKARMVAALGGAGGIPEPGPLAGPEEAIVAFAARAARDPAGLSASDYERLYAEGYSEEQVLEALHVATWAPSLMRMNAALGAGSHPAAGGVAPAGDSG
jgi:hypothetical protein